MNNKYNGEDIIEKARKEIQRGSLVNDIQHIDQFVLTYSSYEDESKEIANEIRWLQASANILSYRKLRSRGGIIGKVLLFIKKAIRKLTKFYIEPIASDQSEYNRHVAKTLDFILESLNNKNKEIKELQEALNILTAKNYRG